MRGTGTFIDKQIKACLYHSHVPFGFFPWQTLFIISLLLTQAFSLPDSRWEDGPGLLIPPSAESTRWQCPAWEVYTGSTPVQSFQGNRSQSFMFLSFSSCYRWTKKFTMTAYSAGKGHQNLVHCIYLRILGLRPRVLRESPRLPHTIPSPAGALPQGMGHRKS